ncbi:MAG: serine hydrolase domain-containing protein [Bacillota bacterium]
MAHTPGFEDKGQGLFMLTAGEMSSLDGYLKANIPARVFPPGELAAYSNYGTALAGYIVERISGILFAEYVEQYIFTPLGMAHSTFRQPLPAALAVDMSGGYNYTGGAFQPGGFEFVQAYPAGSLSSTAADMARFMIAHLQDGRYNETSILEADTARLMHRQHFTHDPRLLGMAHGFFESTVNGRRIISHGGDTFLFHSGLFLLPDEGTGVFVSYNSTAGAAAGAALLEVFMDRYFPAPAPAAPEPLADHRERAQIYRGEYHLSRANFTTVEKLMALLQAVRVSVNADGELLISLMGDIKRFVEIEPGLLRSLDSDDLVVARSDESPPGVRS